MLICFLSKSSLSFKILLNSFVFSFVCGCLEISSNCFVSFEAFSRKSKLPKFFTKIRTKIYPPIYPEQYLNREINYETINEYNEEVKELFVKGMSENW